MVGIGGCHAGKVPVRIGNMEVCVRRRRGRRWFILNGTGETSTLRQRTATTDRSHERSLNVPVAVSFKIVNILKK